MGKHDKCCVGGCGNDKRYPEEQKKKGHVATLKWHHLTTDHINRPLWIKSISRGRDYFEPGDWTYVCSNHFFDGKPTKNNPNPTLYLNESSQKDRTPVKRRLLKRTPLREATEEPSCSSHDVIVPKIEKFGKSSLTFEQLTRECDVHFYTGFIKVDIFKALFEHLKFKASSMKYWDGAKKTLKPSSYCS